MKIAVIVKTGITDPKTYTTHRSKVSFHQEKLFLSKTDKNAIEYALELISKNGGTIDAFTFEKGILAERVLHEALAMGVNTASAVTGCNINNPLEGQEVATKFAEFLKLNKSYDLILTGANEDKSIVSAGIAAQLGYNYYDYVSKINNDFVFESKLSKGHFEGKAKLPAVISVLDSINEPHLPSFVDLRNALKATITEINIGVDSSALTSDEIVADQTKPQKHIFNLNDDPEAVEKLVSTLRQDGILK